MQQLPRVSCIDCMQQQQHQQHQQQHQQQILRSSQDFENSASCRVASRRFGHHLRPNLLIHMQALAVCLCLFLFSTCLVSPCPKRVWFIYISVSSPSLFWALFMNRHMQIQIQIHAVVFNFGAFFFANRFKNARFFRALWTNENDKNRFFPRWKVSSYQDNSPSMSTRGCRSNAFKNGALMLRNISTPLLNGYTRAILERFSSPSFHALFLKPQNPWNPYFCSISWRFCVCVFGPPQTDHQNIFTSQHDNCKSAFRK